MSDAVGETPQVLRAGETHNPVYLEDRGDRAPLANSALFWESAEHRLVFLEEIQRMPELCQTLRGVIDTARRKQ